VVDVFYEDQLAGMLGDRYVVLVRGHAFKARLSDRIGSRGTIIDVTDYPDIAGLCLASDVAVLDYSSLRYAISPPTMPVTNSRSPRIASSIARYF